MRRRKLTEDDIARMPVVYPAEHYRFDITPRRCRTGIPGAKLDCSIAQALVDSDPRIEAAAVSKSVADIVYCGEGVRHHYGLPQSLRVVVAVNDGHGVPEAGTYELKSLAAARARKPVGKVRGQAGGRRPGYRFASSRTR